LHTAEPGESGVQLELGAEQVTQILEAAAKSGNFQLLLRGLSIDGAALAALPAEAENSRLSRSLLQGLMVLASFPRDGSYVKLKTLANTVGMEPSTTHRYLSTLVGVQLIEHDRDTRKYRLRIGS
jgi:DNA-binding MarR family transcriptional regulator